MNSIHLYVNRDKQRATAAAGEVADAAVRLGLSVTDGPEADVIVVLGGDGTILRAAHEFPGVPLLGLNLGGLGYLASVGEKDFASALQRLAEGRYRIAERSVLAVRKGGGAWIRALNDVVVTREMSGHVTMLSLEVDGHAATQYRADGLVISTPTGSTAYSLSAGGPVLMPDSRSLVVTPMNPHALSIRPMVLSDSARIRVTAQRRPNGVAEKTGVYADGERVFMLDGDESIELVRAERGAAMVELEGYDPYEVLSNKLGWSGSVTP